MRALANGRFQQDFNHPCDASYRPDDCLGLPHIVDQATILYNEADMDRQISDFVESNLLNAADLPAWMQATCKADVTTYVKTLLHGQEDNQCDITPFNKSYEATKKDQTSTKCAAMLVYANGTLTEVGVASSIHALYFLGVFYPSGSPVAAAVGQMQDEAYADAQTLTSVSSITDDPNLADALKNYGSSKFQSKYEYDFGSTPVDFPTGETQALLTRADLLGFFQGRDTTSLDAWVKNQIFSGLNIPIPEAEAEILEEVQTVYKSIFDDTQRGAWNVRYLDKTSLLKNVKNVNPVAINAVIAYWAQDTTTVGVVDGKTAQIPVSITYIYFLGVVHECKPDSLTEDLFKKFCTSIPGNTETDLDGNVSILQKELKPYTRAGWNKAYNFDFDDPKGPPARATGSPFLNTELLFEWAHIPTVDEVKSQIDHIWYKRDQKTIFKHCGAEIYDDLVDQISYRAGPDTVKVDFDWQQGNLITEYNFTATSGVHTMNEYALFTFAYGQVTEDGHGADTHEVFSLSYLSSVFQLPIKTEAESEWEL